MERDASRPADLAGELVLLAVESSPRAHPARALDAGVLGAEVVELALAGRVQVTKDRVSVVDPAPTGRRTLDERLSDLVAAGAPQQLARYLERRSRGLRDRTLDRLAAEGLVEERPSRWLGVFRLRRWFLTGAGAAAGARARLDALVHGTEPAAVEAVALAALVRATRLDRVLYPGRDGRGDRSRLERIGRDQPVGEAVGRAIAAIEAVDAAVAATVVVVADGGAAAGAHGGHGGH